MQTKIQARAAMPADPYDIVAWEAFYAANPRHRRSVGAEGVNDGDEGASDGDESQPNDTHQAEPRRDEPAAKVKPTDAEAQLLKDVMKHKERAKQAAAELEAAKSKLAAYEGIDVEEVRKLLAEKQAAEERAAIARGEFDKVRAQMTEQHKAALSAKEAEIAAKEAETQALRSQIEELTVGNSFAASRFLAEETILTAGKARVLYGAHFDVVDGQIVGYDKPRGAPGRAPIVDAKGDPAGFEDALRKVIEADPDRDTLLRSKVKPGADSGPAKKSPTPPQPKLTGIEKIKAGLGTLPKKGAGK